MTTPPIYLLDTNIISELRKQEKADSSVQQFFNDAIAQGAKLYLSVITLGEIRRGVELIRHRGDLPQAELLEVWLQRVLEYYGDCILDFTATEAQIWGCLRAPHPQNAIDKQIAATALRYDLTLVTRNSQDFVDTGVRVLNPFHYWPGYF